jgi:hypothetical protein
MSERFKKKKRTGAGVETNVRRYVAGIIFIMLSIVIISATTYIASVIPSQTFPPKPSSIYTIPPGNLLFNTTLVLNNNGTITVDVRSYTGNIGWDYPVTYYVVLDLYGINANVSSITAIFDYVVYAYANTFTATDQFSLSYKCNYAVASITKQASYETSYHLHYVQVNFNTTVSGQIPFYLYQANTSDALSNLVCVPPYAVSNTIFINFIGWALGIVLLLTAIRKFGIRI